MRHPAAHDVVALESFPALGIVEVQSIARGVVVSDAMAKRAPVTILQSHPISPGKHLIIITGGVAEVDEAMGAGLAAAGATLVDRLFLPQVHPSLPALVRAGALPWNAYSVAENIDAVAVFEAFTVCATVLAADAAAKAAAVVILDMRLGVGLGGKGFFTMTGPLEDIEAASAAGQAVIDRGLLTGVEIIAAPHEDLRRRLMW
jgi:microcompartment protein CcmL/EutN